MGCDVGIFGMALGRAGEFSKVIGQTSNGLGKYGAKRVVN